MTLARRFASADPLDRALALACINALTDSVWRRIAYEPPPAANSLGDVVLAGSDHLGMIGFFPPLVRQVQALGCRLTVIELDQAILHQARCLTAQGWSKRLNDKAPDGPGEKFLAEVYRQVYARAEGRDGPYALETGLHPADPDLIEAARKLKSALQKLQKPMSEMTRLIAKKLEQDEGYMDADTRKRLDAIDHVDQCAAILGDGHKALAVWHAVFGTPST